MTLINLVNNVDYMKQLKKDILNGYFIMSAKEFKQHRLNLNLSQQQLADKLGYTQTYISLIETGDKKPGKKLIKAFELVMSNNKKIKIHTFKSQLFPSGSFVKISPLICWGAQRNGYAKVLSTQDGDGKGQYRLFCNEPDTTWKWQRVSWFREEELTQIEDEELIEMLSKDIDLYT